MRNLIDIYYTRMMLILRAVHSAARGDVVEVIPAYQYEEAVRIDSGVMR